MHLAVQSWDAVTTALPSGLMSSAVTQLVWPDSTHLQRPLLMSQTRARKSSEAVTAFVLSGVRATANTLPACNPAVHQHMADHHAYVKLHKNMACVMAQGPSLCCQCRLPTCNLVDANRGSLG